MPFRNDWLHRTNKTIVRNTSPRKMADRYGEVFVDGGGKPASNVNWIYDFDETAVVGFDPKYWITQAFPDDTVTLMDQAQRDAVDAAELAAQLDSIADEFDKNRDRVRLVLDVFISEFNRHTDIEQAMKNAVANANNLSDLKTSFAAISLNPQRDFPTLKTIIRTALDGT